ncbi:MAG: DUF4340 domain-containing protein [Kiritimatiellia bacterium]
MSNRRFIVFFLTGIVLLAALLAFLSWRSRAVASEVTRNTLCTFAPEAVDEIEIARHGTNVVRLVRGDFGAWSIAAPYSAAAAAAPVARLVDMVTLLPLGDMRTESELAELGEDFVDFGLSGSVRVAVTLRANGVASRVFFGALTASGKDVYARTEGLRNVFTVPVAALDAIPSDADGFRDRTLISTAREQIAGLDLRASESSFIRLVRNASGWRLAAPLEAPADDDVVASLTEALASARIAGFVLPSAAHAAPAGDQAVLPQSALAPYGLASESGLSVTVKSGAGVPDQIVFGSSAGTNLVYALVRNGSAVVTLEAAVADLFRKGDAAFRDTRVFPFGADERVRSISISAGELVYVLSCSTNGVWRLEAPVAAAADQAAATALVDVILRLRGSDVPVGDLGADAVRISVATSARVHPDVTVARALFKECGPWANLRSKTLIELDPKAVRRLSLKPASGAAVSVVFDAERGVWNLDAGSAPATVRVAAVKNLLAALTRVEAVAVETVAASPDDLRRCGLSAPALVIAIDCEGADAVRRNLMLGALAGGGGRYATVGGADAIFVLDRGTVANLMVAITE